MGEVKTKNLKLTGVKPKALFVQSKGTPYKIIQQD